jgi:fructokinase
MYPTWRLGPGATLRDMIVVAGEALVDVVVSPGGVTTTRLGGGPFTVARTIARLDAPVTFVGRLSADESGTRLRAALETDGIRLATPGPVRAPTTRAIAALDHAGRASYRLELDGTSASALLRSDVPADLLGGAVALHVGSLGLVAQPAATTIEALVAAAPPETLVMLDANVRPDAIQHDGDYRARVGRVAARADVVQLSAEDAAWLDRAADPEAVARTLLAAGASVVLLTDGGAPVRALTGAGRLEVPVKSVPVVDTIGAGDAFGGAFLAAWIHAGFRRAELSNAEALEPALTFAVTVASWTCGRVGADPPRRSELAWPPAARERHD